MKQTLLFALTSILVLFAGCSEQNGQASPANAPEGSGAENEESGKGDEMKAGKVAMIIAFEGFQHLEYGVPREALVKAGYAIDVVSSKTGTAVGTGEVKATVTMTLEQLLPKVGEYAGIVFVGGPGSPEFHKNATAHAIAQEAVKQKKVLAAICLAPFTLANAGVLKGIKATAWTDNGEFSPAVLEAAGAIYSPGPVVVSGLILTANGPAAAPAFTTRLLEMLSK